jgi:tetratricopeptide (TPR) repeat protein
VNVRLFALGLMLPACGGLLRAQVQPEPEPAPILDTDTSPYHLALLAYKAGDYDEAEKAFAGTDSSKLDDNAVILRSRILTELKRYQEAEKILRPRLQSGNVAAFQAALGDVLLSHHNFSSAARYYAGALQAHPNDPDLMLKLIYADVGGGNLVEAGQMASQLTPLDPKHPYDDHATYYFARAALAESAGKDGEAQDMIQTARTNYGITVTDRYLRTYLKVFRPVDTLPPVPGQKPPAPSGVQ